ncbi:unnamed protein product [Caenorhabditis auriculariae]|uniref:SEFIR domain-containing protein n=1 Tax=Caenorhabditis auriculariae TaxID=2777116 RepID=A0A8S1HHF7_9PELO|nr:unnamed protein product [Caenorhabditis auriculariae]
MKWIALVVSVAVCLVAAEDLPASERTPTRLPVRVTKEGVVTPAALAGDLPRFQSDCSDPHNKDIVCSVHLVECEARLFEDVPSGQEPPEAHDVRVEAFAKAKARREGVHVLHVDISWQLPPKNNSALLRAFKLQVSGGGETSCFVFNVSDSSEEIASPRFHFTSETMFGFAKNYSIAIISLPSSASKTPKTTKMARMPEDPEVLSSQTVNNTAEYCKTQANPHASKWTAGFRKIFLLAVARTIQIEFVAAPAHYCFEEYEVRLLDGSGLELLHSTILRADEMRTEVINGKTITFGEHNFTGLSLNTDYIPSVIPVETSSDGRCLCPTIHNTACSCVAADWKTVRLSKVEKPPQVVSSIPKDVKEPEGSNWYVFAVLSVLVLLGGICVLTFLVVGCYRKYEKSGKMVRIRFISDQPPPHSQTSTPLIYNAKNSALIIYSHDCALHEAAVCAFADLLRNALGLDVHLDAYDEEDIERNRSDYINASIVRADKVIVINSVGAYQRVLARQLRQPAIERLSPGQNDALFLQQIDLALQHVRVISVRFSYTPSKYTLFALSPLLQYTIPDNLSLLAASICDGDRQNETRLAGYHADLSRLHAAATRMAHYVESEPKWFEKTHHRTIEGPVRSYIHKNLEETTSELEEVPENSNETQELLLDPHAIPVVGAVGQKMDSLDSSRFDSAYMSGELSQQIEAQLEVRDKPRLEARRKHEEVSGTFDSAIVEDIDSRLYVQ